METAPANEISQTAVSETRLTPAVGLKIQGILDSTYAKFKNVDDGTVATYIPELGKANPKDFGLCVATVDGQVFTAGDWDKEFTIQSMCKPFAFQMALEQRGTEEVLKRVGVEPSGEAFNSIEFDPKSGRPFNPMVNAGAIAVASLIKQAPVEAGIEAFVDQMGRAAGRELRIDESVLASETLTGNRNRAIAYMLLNSGIIDEEVQQSLAASIPFPKRLGKADEYARLAAHVVTNLSLNGEVIRLDGALRLPPR